MLALLDQTNAPFVADQAEAVIAREAANRLKPLADGGHDIKIAVKEDDRASVIVPLPARAVQLIYTVLEAMAEQTPLSLIPHEAELTTQQAADYLNVSRPYLIKKLEGDEIPYRKIGSHRRIKFSDLLEYEAQTKAKRLKALAAMNREAVELGLE